MWSLVNPSYTLLSFRPADPLLSWLSGGSIGVFWHSWCFVCTSLFFVMLLVCRPGGVVWLSGVAGSLPWDFQGCFGKRQVKLPSFSFFFHFIETIRVQTSAACFLLLHLFLCYIYFSPPHLTLFACSAITRFACDHLVHTHTLNHTYANTAQLCMKALSVFSACRRGWLHLNKVPSLFWHGNVPPNVWHHKLVSIVGSGKILLPK